MFFKDKYAGCYVDVDSANICVHRSIAESKRDEPNAS